jgi:hypothetical protein
MQTQTSDEHLNKEWLNMRSAGVLGDKQTNQEIRKLWSKQIPQPPNVRTICRPFLCNFVTMLGGVER